MEAVRETVRALRREAADADERRLLVLAGERERGYAALRAAVSATPLEDVVSVSDAHADLPGETLRPTRTDRLLGTTRECVALDCHDECRPNAIGRAGGAVDGGGLLVLVTPPLDEWPDRRDGFDRTLAAPPFEADDVGNRFRRRLVSTLRSHRGIAIVDVDEGAVAEDGLTSPAPRLPRDPVGEPPDAEFPRRVYEACLTADQRDAVLACERLRDAGTAVVLESDRGRGKSSAAGLAAAALAEGGDSVLVTAPSPENAAEVFDRAAELLGEMGVLEDDAGGEDGRRELRTGGPGRVYYRPPTDAAGESADAVVVDEAAALPVRLLESLLDVAPSACFATTVHGYEGAGRGFGVRFRDRLTEARDLETVPLAEPIRYAAGDPVEVWLFRVLLLDARPAVDPLIEGHGPGEAVYERPAPARLVDDETRLREIFGLLVEAHYRTEPNDLARLLDAPNIAVRALTVGGHVVSVALLERGGGLPEPLRREIYEGARVRGNMIPDVLTSQLRDPDAAVPVGLRVMRIATHSAARSRGFGSELLSAIEAEFDPDGDRRPGRFGPMDYLGVGYGATPELVSFWDENGYATVHLSTTRNDRSGEYSAIMLRPLSPAGEALAARHAEWFLRRVGDALLGPLDDVDPDVVRSVLAAAGGSVDVALSAFEWRAVVGAAYGPGIYDTAPGPFRRLALRALVDGAAADPDSERLLVAKALQARSWEAVTAMLGYVSRRECMLAFGEAYRPLVDRYGTAAAREEADRYR